MKLTIGADLVPTQSNIASFEQGDARQLVGDELLSLLAGADFRLFNLEVPLTDRLSPIPKCGPHLSAPERTAAGIVSIGADLCTLANNHIMDQGAQGLRRTLELLREKKVRTVGAGETLAQALQPVFLEKDGQKVGVYACAEHEFSIAGENQPGANPFDPYESFDHVAALRAQCDYLIVLYHGGKEHYRYPSPGLQKTCRKLVEKGADLVVCQHSHCIGCEEDYGNGKIVYGQGNFLFDHSEREFWQTSLLILVDTQQKQQVRYVPLRKQGRTVRLAEQQDAAEILEQFYRRSSEIGDPGFVKRQYRNFAQEMRANYFGAWKGNTFFTKVRNRLSGRRYLQAPYSEESLLALRNYVECEAHRELVLEVFRQTAEEKR